MKKVGRPKGKNNKDFMCSIRMDESTLRRLEAYCKKMSVAKSEAVREAIELLVNVECNDDTMEDDIKNSQCDIISYY